MQSEQDKSVNFNEILNFTKKCAVKLLKLKGIDTPDESIIAIAEELQKLNPKILENRKGILLTIALGDFQFRTPKQMTIDDFNVTQEKINTLKNFVMKVYTEKEVLIIKQNITNSKIQVLENEIENQREKYRILEFNWKNFPEPSTKKGYEDIMNLQNELMNQNLKLTEEIDLKDRIIRRLEEKGQRHNLLKNGTDFIAETSEETLQEKEEA